MVMHPSVETETSALPGVAAQGRARTQDVTFCVAHPFRKAWATACRAEPNVTAERAAVPALGRGLRRSRTVTRSCRRERMNLRRYSRCCGPSLGALALAAALPLGALAAHGSV